MLVEFTAVKRQYKPDRVQEYLVLVNPAFVVDVQPAEVQNWPASEAIRHLWKSGPLTCVTVHYGTGHLTHHVLLTVEGVRDRLAPRQPGGGWEDLGGVM